MNHTDPTADVRVAEARRAVHESLILLPAWEADRVRSLIADLETAVEFRAVSAVVSPPTSRADQTAKPLGSIVNPQTGHGLATGGNWPAPVAGQTCHCGQASTLGVMQTRDGHVHIGPQLTPTPADRAAVLLRTADIAERLMDERYGPDCSYAIGGLDVARELRRLAAEAQQQPDTETPVEETGAALARYLADRRLSELQAAFRILGWPPLRFELVDAAEPAPAEQQPAAADGEARS